MSLGYIHIRAPIGNERHWEICVERKLETRRDWTFKLADLNHYSQAGLPASRSDREVPNWLRTE